MRIAVIGLLHESNTFVDTTTSRDDFQACSLDIGPDVLRRWRSAHHEIGGFLAGAERFGFEPVPIVAAVAMPSGPLAQDTFEGLWRDMDEGLRGAGALDGILLALHGATVAVNAPDADGEIVTRLRARVGPDMPIVMTLDLHANVSPRMVEGVTASIFYRTTPHVDQLERGLEAAQMITRTIRGEIRPVQALERPPMLMDITRQDSSQEPAALLLREVENLVREPSILSASVGYAYPRADVEEMGTSIVVVADADRAAAARGARRLADRAWELRDRFVADTPAPDRAVAEAGSFEGQPVVVSDLGDNIGGGAPGDATLLLEEILRQGVENALVTLWDPPGAAACRAAGVGAQVSLEVGGRTDQRLGKPVAVRGRVRTISDGRFFEPEPRHGGRSDNNQGLTAVLETDRQLMIVLTTLRMAPMSLWQILSLGIDPRTRKLIVVKAAIAPRAAYAPVAARFILANTPGPTSSDLQSFRFSHRLRPMFPWEPEAVYRPDRGAGGSE